MKYIFLSFLLVSFLSSCDYILKDSAKKSNEFVVIDSLRNNQIIDDNDVHGCDNNAGYKWSNLQKKCIRVFEEGFRLSSLAKDSLGNHKNAYFLIGEDSLQAEIFLPDSKESIILKREDEDEPFKFHSLALTQKGGYALLINNRLVFKPALAVDVKMIETGEQEIKNTNQEKDSL